MLFASVVRPSCCQIFSGQLRPAPDRSFSDFFGGPSHHARIGSSGHFPATDFFITILLGPCAFSPCRFFADFSVTCTPCRKWEFLHRPRLRSRPGNAPTPCRHHEQRQRAPAFMPPPTGQNTRPDTVTPSNDQTERRNDSRERRTPPRIPGNNQNMLYTVRIH